MEFKRYLLLIFFLSFVKHSQENNQDDKTCEDKISSTVCQRFAKFGACVNMDKRMNQICRRTCEFCGNVCKDRFKRECRIWVYHGACTTHRKFMKNLCRESCGFCVASAPPKEPACTNTTFGCCWNGIHSAKGPNYYGCGRCEDSLLFCRMFYEDCISGRNRPFMLRRCPKTCKLCKVDESNRVVPGPVRPIKHVHR